MCTASAAAKWVSSPMVEGRTLTAGIMFAIFLVMVALAFTYEPGARMLPLVVGIPGLLLSGTQFIVELRSSAPQTVTPAEVGAEWRMFGWVVLFVAGIVAFGFPYAGPILVAVYLRVSW